MPSATEIVYALGLGDQLVGVSHACDYPSDATAKPVVSQSVRQITHLSSEEIDGIVRQARANSNPLYWIDGGLLRELKPDLIITQELCEGCAIDSGSVFETAAKVLDYQPEILTIRPNFVADILQNVRNIATEAGVPKSGADLAESLQRRVHTVVNGVGNHVERPRVLCLDWLDRQDAAEKLTDLTGWNELPAVQMDQVFLFDGRIPTRHGPRVVDVLEGLARAMHPQRFEGITSYEVLVKDRS